MTDILRITNGRVYDPINGVDGAVRDVIIVDGKIVAALPDGVRPGSTRTIDAGGMIVMPGGVDIHCHIASASANRARAMLGEEHATHVHACQPAEVSGRRAAESGGARTTGPHPSPLPGGEGAGASRPAETTAPHGFRAGTGVLTPSTFLTGYRYAALGYTTAIDAAVSPTGARQTHLELDDTPNLDAGFLLLVGNHAKVIELLATGDEAGAVAGALIVAGLGNVANKGRNSMIMQICFGLTIIMFSLNSSVWLAYPIIFLASICMMGVFSMIASLVQLIVEDNMRGRVMSIYMLAFRGGAPLGSLITGLLAEKFPLQRVLLVEGAMLSVLALVFLLSPSKVKEY